MNSLLGTAVPSSFSLLIGGLRHDGVASIVVFLVALPLCIGITIASGAPTGSGIVTGIVAGLVVGWLSGCPLQVSGPAAGLTVIVYELIREQGLEAFAVIVIAAGFIQILWSWLQLGQWFRAVSPAVIHGMLAGIGALIFASQFHIMIDDLPKGSGLENILSLPSAVWKGLIDDDSTPMNHHLAARIGVLTIGTMVLWNVVLPKRFHVMPAVLLGVASATAVSALLDIPIQRIEVQDNLLSIVHFPSIQMLPHVFDTSILAEALGLAFIASVETLLSASAVDQLHTGPRTRYNRELLAQGVGNMICGVLGSLPMTGVIVRSSANVEAGARTRASAILHGVWLLLFVSLLPSVLRFIPTASLGAVLLALGGVVFLINVARSYAWGAIATDNPWNAGTLEWATTSPPPVYNFLHIPVVEGREALWERSADAPVVGYFEWFYRARDADADFLDPATVTQDEALRIRTRNAGILIEF